MKSCWLYCSLGTGMLLSLKLLWLARFVTWKAEDSERKRENLLVWSLTELAGRAPGQAKAGNFPTFIRQILTRQIWDHFIQIAISYLWETEGESSTSVNINWVNITTKRRKFRMTSSPLQDVLEYYSMGEPAYQYNRVSSVQCPVSIIPHWSVS